MARLATVALALTCATISAQGRHLFDIDQGQSAFTFSGTLTLGPATGNIVGTPPNFLVSGGAELDLTVAGGVLTTGQIVTGSTVATVPALSAEVPNPIPILPPLITATVTGVTLTFESTDPNGTAPASFPINGAGAFSANVVGTFQSGTATITVTGFPPQSIPLTGIVSNVAPVSGTVVPTPLGFQLVVPVNGSFPFTDPLTGATGTFTVNGAVVANDRALAVDTDTISLGTGGTQNLRLSAGSTLGSRFYILLGTATGTSPGFVASGVPVPLNPDGWTQTTLAYANIFPFGNSAGFLDPLGVADATITFPALPPSFAGLSFVHAYVAFDAGIVNVVSASNPVSLALLP